MPKSLNKKKTTRLNKIMCLLLHLVYTILCIGISQDYKEIGCYCLQVLQHGQVLLASNRFLSKVYKEMCFYY